MHATLLESLSQEEKNSFHINFLLENLDLNALKLNLIIDVKRKKLNV